MNLHHMPESSGVTLTRKGERYILDNPTLPAAQGAPPAAADVPAAPSARRKRRQAPRASRADAEAMIERLLAAVEDLLVELDAIDGEPDLEPSLGSIERHPVVDHFTGTARGGGQTRWAAGARDDREEEHDGREDLREEYEDGGDDEQSLGWTLAMNQDGKRWHGSPPETGPLAWAVQDGEQASA